MCFCREGCQCDCDGTLNLNQKNGAEFQHLAVHGALYATSCACNEGIRVIIANISLCSKILFFVGCKNQDR